MPDPRAKYFEVNITPHPEHADSLLENFEPLKAQVDGILAVINSGDGSFDLVPFGMLPEEAADIIVGSKGFGQELLMAILDLLARGGGGIIDYSKASKTEYVEEK